MQLIYPGSHNLIFLFNFLIVLVIGVVGVIFFFQCIKRIRKQGWTILRVIFFISSGLMIIFSLYNIVNYQVIFYQSKKENIGTYVNSDNGYFIKLNQDMTWSSSREIFNCTVGEWVYILDDDGEWINLLGDCEQYFHYQLKPTKDNKTIEIYPQDGVLLNDVKQLFEKD